MQQGFTLGLYLAIALVLWNRLRSKPQKKSKVLPKDVQQWFSQPQNILYEIKKLPPVSVKGWKLQLLKQIILAPWIGQIVAKMLAKFCN